MIDLELDLGDGTIIKTERSERRRTSERTPQRFLAPEKIAVTSIPVAVVIHFAYVTCLGCEAEHKDHRGIFIEHRLSNGVTSFRRISLREIGPYTALPRRVDQAPREAVPICSECFLIEKLFKDAVAVAQAEGEIFGSPDKPSPIPEIAINLGLIHQEQQDPSKKGQ